MHLVSTGKTTILSDFADLETKSTYQHQNAEATDFQFYPGSNIFVEVNKNSGFQVMRIKGKDEMNIVIEKVLKLKIENAYCVGCAHQSLNEITLGLNNGQVWVYNYKSREILHRFAGEKMNSVVYVDFNAADDYIAATHENGLINIYGNKTRAKLESINIDSQPLLARFHPTKRFHLAIASHMGAVTVYDTGAKRKVFHSTDSHSAPCRDCTWSLASPDTLISVGYDCIINIFDTRRKGSPIKLTQKYPLSAVALSDCGQFFCVGNLKGGLATYDLRNTKTELSFKKVHDGAINRVSFVPDNGSKTITQDSLNQTVNTSQIEESNTGVSASRGLQRMHSNDMRKSLVTAARGQRDSFCDFMDFQMSKGVEKASSARSTASANRDSFDWENLVRKPSWIKRGSLTALTSSNLSPILSDDTESLDVSIQKSSSLKQSKEQQAPLRERNLIISPADKKLVQIEEEQQHEDQNDVKDSKKVRISCGKENANSLLEEQTQRQVNFSTPIAGAQQHAITIGPPSSCSQNSYNEIVKQIGELRVEMDVRFKDLESELKFEAERNKWQIFSQANDLWCKQYQGIEEIRDAMMFLLQTDPFVQEFTRLKQENQNLKEQLERLLRKK